LSRKIRTVLSFSCILALATKTSEAHRVIFEEIGTLAGALHYHHIYFELGVPDLFAHVQAVNETINRHDQEVAQALATDQPVNETTLASLTNGYINGAAVAGALRHNALTGLLGISSVQRTNNQHLQTRLQNLKGLFPAGKLSAADAILNRAEFDEPVRQLTVRNQARPANATAFPHLSHREQRFAWAILGAVAGTFNGIYTRKQLAALKQDLFALRAETDALTKVSKVHSTLIWQIDTAISDISRALLLLSANPAALTNARFQQLIDLTGHGIDKALRALQAAQYRRLSIDFMDPDQLLALFEKLKTYSVEHQKVLLLEQPSDLLQCELSYFFTGDDIMFLLHVPMAPSMALLRLMRYRPFPIPLDDSTGMIPVLDQDVLAISQGSAIAGTRLTMEVRFTDLMECHQINSIYLCEHHGVLHYQSNRSCLASLYGQDHAAAVQLCRMNIVPLDEAVLALGRNSFLIYNDKPGYNGELSCLDQQGSDISLRKGLNELTLQEHCQLRLRSSIIFADSSVHLAADIHKYDWEWDRSLATAGIFRRPEVITELKERAQKEAGTLHLHDILNVANQHQHDFAQNIMIYVLYGLAGLTVAGLLFLAWKAVKTRDLLIKLARWLAVPTLKFFKPYIGNIPIPTFFRTLLRNAEDILVENDMQLPADPPPRPSQNNSEQV